MATPSRRRSMYPYTEFYRKHLGVINGTLKMETVVPELLDKKLILHADKEDFDRTLGNQGGVRAIEKLFTTVIWRRAPAECDEKLADILYRTGHVEILKGFITEFPQFAAKYQGALEDHYTSGVCNFANADRSAMNPPKVDFKLTQKDNRKAAKFGQFICNIFWRSKHYATGFIIGSIPFTTKVTVEQKRHFLVMTNHHVWKKVKDNMHADPDICAVHAVFTTLGENHEIKREICFFDECLFQDEKLDYALLILHHDEFLNETFPQSQRTLRSAPQGATAFQDEGKIGVFNELSKYIYKREVQPGENLALLLIGYPDTETQQHDRPVVKTQHARAMYSQSDLALLEADRCRVFYKCTSYHGSSGAPCFDIQSNRLYCMQCGGVGERGSVEELEHGVLLCSVVKHMQVKVESNPECFNKDLFYQLFPDFKADG